MSPELIAPQKFGLKNKGPTKSSDCYALGMVIYETISGNLPFHEDADLSVFLKVLEGACPPQGPGFTGGLWEMLEQCWTSQPNDRPGVERVLQCLESVSNSIGPSSPGMDEEMENSGDDSGMVDSSPGSSEEGSGWNSLEYQKNYSLRTSGIITAERNDATPSGSGNLNHPFTGTHIDDLDLLLPPIGSNNGGTYQVSTIQSHITPTLCSTYCIGPAHSTWSNWSS